MTPTADDIDFARRSALACIGLFRLPFRRELWRGAVGNWAGAGIGSSIDFQDHRPYVPGDDPRYIDWQAYARSDHYVMKLYREEVSPAVDLVLDASESMFADRSKARRSLELFYFALESALATGAAVRPWTVTADRPARMDVHTVRGESRWLTSGARVDGSLLHGIELRPGSLRVVVSDLLFPGEPDPMATTIASSKGRGIVLAPSSTNESEPSWLGQVELEDCETGLRRSEHIDATRLEGYRRVYARHFDMWETSCRRRGIPLARMPAELELTEALRAHALRVSAVEPAA